MRKSSYKKVNITTESPMADFSLPGAAKIAQDGATTSFLYSGEINALFARLASLPLVNADISEPELEEIFLHYYEDGEAQQ